MGAEHRSNGGDGTHREVYAAGKHDEEHSDGHDAGTGGDLAHHVHQVALRQECIRPERGDQYQDQEDAERTVVADRLQNTGRER